MSSSLRLPRSLAPVSPLAASTHFLVCIAVSIALFLPQTLSPGLWEAKSSPVDPPCISVRTFVLACAGGCGTEESQKGAPTSNKKDLRSPRHLNNSDSQVPFHPTCLLGISGSGMLASLALLLKIPGMLGLELCAHLPSWLHRRGQAGAQRGNVYGEVVRLEISPRANGSPGRS